MGIVLRYRGSDGEGEIEFAESSFENIRVTYPSPDTVVFCDKGKMVFFRGLFSWTLESGLVEKGEKDKDAITLVLDDDDAMIVEMALKGMDVSDNLRKPHQALLRLLERLRS